MAIKGQNEDMPVEMEIFSVNTLEVILKRRKKSSSISYNKMLYS